MRLVSHRRYRWNRSRADKEPVQGRLPQFSRSLGLDVIITEAGRPLLIELQHGFGRRGLIELFPEASRRYRQTYWRLRRENGRSLFVAEEIRRICSDKIVTYRHFAAYQPPSFAFSRWGPDVEAWLDTLSEPLVLSKPPRGSCGKGILVLEREPLRRARGALPLGAPPVLLQEFVRSRPLLDEAGRAHLGCIRHIVVLHSDGRRLGLVHMPSYWRVASAALEGGTREALTANISQGAYPLPVDAADHELVRGLAEEVVVELVRTVLQMDHVPRAPSEIVD
jgi:hypothetical protein